MYSTTSSNKNEDYYLNKVKSIILNLKNILKGILKTPVIIVTYPLRRLVKYAIKILNNKLLDKKYQSIHSSDSTKTKKIKLSAEEYKKYIIFFIKTCEGIIKLFDITDQYLYQIILYYIISTFTLNFFDFKNTELAKKYLITIYQNNKYIMLNILNKITARQIGAISFIALLNLVE